MIGHWSGMSYDPWLEGNVMSGNTCLLPTISAIDGNGIMMIFESGPTQKMWQWFKEGLKIVVNFSMFWYIDIHWNSRLTMFETS